MQVVDNSMHRHIIPAERAREWDEFCAIPDDDPLSWTVPSWAKKIEGALTFTDPRME